MNVGELEERLLRLFPRADAENWDHVGLSVGDPDAPVARVVVALDASEENVREAAELGANVLLTHHPVYIKAPAAFTPRSDAAHTAPAATVYAAVKLGVSIISLHTNLDRSLDARRLLPSLTGLTAISSLEHAEEPERTGLGAIAEADGLDLQTLAARCAAAFGTDPRIWGNPNLALQRVAFLGGSLGDLGELALVAGADAIVCGEAGYHVCQDLSLRGCSVILLGHDRSEEVFVNILKDALARTGVSGDCIATIEHPMQWWTLTRGDRS